MTTNYRINGTDTDDLFVRKDLFTEGGLWLWGRNAVGGLGDNSAISKSSPVQTVSGGTNWKQVSVGADFTFALKTDGTLWGWGTNFNGELGDNSRTPRSSPVQTAAGGTNWRQVSSGANNGAAIKTDGTLWLWGFNGSGQLGDNTAVNKSSPIQTVSGGTNWKQVAFGTAFVSAIKTDGTLWLWGYNGYGNLGDNTLVNKSSPIQTVSGGTNWKQIACGYFFTAAIKTDGSLWMWGYNGFGQLGDNTTVDKSSPIQTVSGGTNWKQVSCGGRHTAAIKTDGTLWLWGINENGCLGNNSTIRLSSPVQTISGGTNWKQVSVATDISTAIKTDGTLWTWGYNQYGALGDNSVIHRSSPVQTISGGTNWKQVNVGTSSSLAERSNTAGIREDYWA